MTHLVRKLLVLCATVGGMSVLFAATALAQDGGTISGRVIDATTNAPIPSAQVQIVGTARGGTTAEDGRFRIPSVRPGVYQVRVLRIGYQAGTQSVTVANTQAISLEYSLTPVAITLDQVVTLATGETTRKREQGNVVGTLTPEPATLATAGQHEPASHWPCSRSGCRNSRRHNRLECPLPHSRGQLVVAVQRPPSDSRWCPCR